MEFRVGHDVESPLVDVLCSIGLMFNGLTNSNGSTGSLFK